MLSKLCFAALPFRIVFRSKLATFCAAAVCVSIPCSASAVLTLLTSRAGANANVTIDWQALGGANTDVATNPFSINSDTGRAFTVSKPTAGAFNRRNQNPPAGGGWAGNFAPGDALLTHLNSDGPVVIAVTAAQGVVSAAGLQIQPNQSGAFVATIEAFDVSGASLGSFSVNGTSDANGDNSAIFIGVVSDVENIHSVSVDTNTTAFGGDFAINRVSLKATVTQDPPSGGVQTTWLGGTGLWNDPAKWSNGVPNSPSFEASVDNLPGTNSVVTISAGNQGSVGRLRIDAGDRVQTQDNSNLYVTATAFAGAGELLFNGTLAIPGQVLVGDKVINGTGKLMLGGVVGQNARVTGATTNNGTIEGSGQFGFYNSDRYRTDNNGTINANVPGQALLLYGLTGASRSTNTDTMKATNGGRLLLGQGQWFGSPTSSITANGPDSQLLFSDSVLVEGGTLSATDGGLLRPGGEGNFNSSAIWKDLTVSGPTQIRNGALLLEGTVTNNGVMTVQNAAGGIGTEALPNVTTIAGAGQIVLEYDGDPTLGRNGNGYLHIQNQVIRGEGKVGRRSNNDAMELTNQGTFQADRNARTLRLEIRSLDNRSGGTLRAIDGGILTLSLSGRLQNTGGTIEALNGGRVQAEFARIEGGLVRNVGGFIPLGGMTLFNPGSGMRLEGNLTLGLPTANQEATIINGIENTGILRVASSGPSAALRVGENGAARATLTGGGELRLGDVANGSNESYLTEYYGFQGFGEVTTLTNTDNVISGFGRFGDSDARRLIFVNRSLVRADTSAETLFVGLRSIDNANASATLRASGGGTLALSASLGLNNVGGTIEALTNSTLNFWGSTVVDGGLLQNLGGTFDVGSATLRNPGTGITLQGPLTVGNGKGAYLVGAIRNEGSVAIRSLGAQTFVAIGVSAAEPDVSLSGGGEIILGDASNGSAASFLVEQNHNVQFWISNFNPGDNAIRGFGQIGNFDRRGLALVNNNVISADVAGKTLALYPRSLVNAPGKTMRATNGGNLHLDSLTLTNTGATIFADANSTVTFAQRTFTGGLVRSAPTGTLNFQEGPTAQGAIIENNGLALLGHASQARVFEGRNNGASQFLNAVMIKKINASDYWLAVPLTHTGLMLSEAGLLHLIGGGTVTNGTFGISPGAEIRFHGPEAYAFSGDSNTFLGMGRAVATNATLTLADAATTVFATNFRFDGNSTLTGPGSLNVSGQLDLRGYDFYNTLSSAVLRLEAGGIGLFGDAYRGTLRLNNGAILENNGTLTFAQQSIITGENPGVFRTNPTGITNFSDTTTLSVPVEINDTGGWTLNAAAPRAVAVQRGGSFTNAKFNSTLVTSEWQFTGTDAFKFYGQANESVGGVMNFGGVRIEFQDTTPTDPADDPRFYTTSQILFTGTAGNIITGRGEFSTTGGFVFSSGNVSVDETILVNDAITPSLSLFSSPNGRLSLYNGARFINNSPLKIQAAGSTFTGTANTLFHNTSGGRVIHDINTTTIFDVPFLNVGFLEFRAGIINFLQPFSGNGGIAVSGGSKVDLGTTAFTDPSNLPSGLQASGAGSELKITLANGQVHEVYNPNAIKAEAGGKVEHRGGDSLKVTGPDATGIAQGAGSQLIKDGGNLIGLDSASMIGLDGGSIVAAGAGNVLSHNGGAIVAAGAGNIVAAGAGNMVAAGGLNRPGSSDAQGRPKLRASRPSLDEMTGTPGLDALMAKVDALSTDPSAGRIFVDTGSTASVAMGSIIAENGGIIAGGGTFTGPGLIKSGGALLPGSTVGTLTWNGNLTIQSGGSLEVEIGGTTAGTQYDVVNVSGAFTMNGSLGVKMLNSFGSTVQAADAFDIVSSGVAMTPVAAGTRIAVTGANGTFEVALVNDGKTLRLTNYAKVPITFSSWAARHGLTGENASLTANPDGDGMSNLLEYALGKDPNAADGSGVNVGTEAIGDFKYLTLTYTRPTENHPDFPSDITYAHERATTLSPTADWSSANVTAPETAPVSGNRETVKVRSTVPIGSMNTKEFLHLKVTLSQ